MKRRMAAEQRIRDQVRIRMPTNKSLLQEMTATRSNRTNLPTIEKLRALMADIRASMPLEAGVFPASAVAGGWSHRRPLVATPEQWAQLKMLAREAPPHLHRTMALAGSMVIVKTPEELLEAAATFGTAAMWLGE